jgi:hypothetical protein
MLKFHDCFIIYFSGSLLPTATLLLIIRNWASWSDRPFIMGDIEDELSLVLSAKILSIVVPESF